jgi:DNA-binding transcriptional LysR family regulator
MLNFRHLYYFWVVTKEGGFARAAERLDMAVQTISAQVRELEKALGHQLLKPAGRGIALTEAGEAAFARAEEVFQIGQAIAEEVREAASNKVVRLSVGLSDGISKLAVHAMLAPILTTPSLRLVCHEGEVQQLLAELAMHHLDLVLAGQPAPNNNNLRLTSERLVQSPVEWYGPVTLVRKAEVAEFPQSLGRLPILLPTGQPRSLVRNRGPAATHRGGIRRQCVDGRLCSARAGCVSGQPARRLGSGADARVATARSLARRFRGDPCDPVAPRTTSPARDAAAGERTQLTVCSGAQVCARACAKRGMHSDRFGFYEVPVTDLLLFQNADAPYLLVTPQPKESCDAGSFQIS